MQGNTQDDNSMSDRILTDIERIFKTEGNVEAFSIVPTLEIKNKSPVLVVDNELGLESWCVKHVYRYAYIELFKVRQLLKRNRLSKYKMEELNKLLIGTLLINPDVSTFWNMRRELVEYEVVNINKELALTKLVLSHKSKSNEAMAYRKWIVSKMMGSLDSVDYESRDVIMNEEFSVAAFAADKSQNNYHAWTHRVWTLQHIAGDQIPTILNELLFSLKWIQTHVSEYSGFHYRQHLFRYIKKNDGAEKIYVEFKRFRKIIAIEPGVDIDLPVLHRFLGERDTSTSCCEGEYSFGLSGLNYLCLLMIELFHTVDSLKVFYPGHESLWYHHRYVIYHLLKFAYDYHGLSFKPKVKIDDTRVLSSTDVNILNAHLDNASVDYKIQENGEKYPKLLKYETNKVESSDLYKMLVKYELQCIKKYSANVRLKVNYNVEKELAKRHEKWLRHVICLNGI